MSRTETLEALLDWLLFEVWEVGVLDVDGGDLQDKLEALGLIYEDKATEDDVGGTNPDAWAGFEGEIGDPIYRKVEAGDSFSCPYCGERILYSEWPDVEPVESEG